MKFNRFLIGRAHFFSQERAAVALAKPQRKAMRALVDSKFATAFFTNIPNADTAEVHAKEFQEKVGPNARDS